METVSVKLPKADLKLFETISERFGWVYSTICKPKKSIGSHCGLDEAMDDIKEGRVYRAANTEDLFKQILG